MAPPVVVIEPDHTYMEGADGVAKKMDVFGKGWKSNVIPCAGQMGRIVARGTHEQQATLLTIVAIRLDKWNGAGKSKTKEGDIVLMDPQGIRELPDPDAFEVMHSVIDQNTTMLKDDRFKDVTFRLADGEIGAHRSVLAAASDALAAMFASSMQEGSSGYVDLKNVDCETMRVFLRQIYTGHVDPEDWGGSEDGALPLRLLLACLKLARKYMVSMVLDLCVDATKQRLRSKPSVEDFDEILSTAIAADEQPIRHVALEVARASSAIRREYDAGALRPEVQHELRALWPAPRKKMRRQTVS
mmetsp:Transcript_134420/g.287583  ORF Transcript_134420/g.287583 Transcript_134420/m.287583 type:complete len:300 (+) Transcript_134420:74-973(+)